MRTMAPWSYVRRRSFGSLAPVVLLLSAICALRVLGIGGGDVAEARAGGSEVGRSAVVADERCDRIAIKLAPGARIAETGDGSLTVVRDWASLETAAGPGMALEVAGGIGSLGVTILEPVPTGLGSDGSAGVDGSAVDLGEAARALRLLPGVLWAEVAQPVRACLVPNDPYYPASTGSVGQWGVERVGLPQAWDITTGSGEIVVAVIDTGVNPNVPDFSGRIVAPYSVLSKDATWPAWRDDSSNGHGTAVTGIAVAQGDNGHGIAGTAWNVKVMPIKISVDGESDTITLAEGIVHAVTHGADVINVSFATPPGSTAGQTLRNAVTAALDAGVTIVAAAGNWDATSVGFPAGLSGVIAVAATDSSDARWQMGEQASNMGSALDLAAPGGRILTYYRAAADRLGYYGGTSMAAPFVSGVAALMLSVDPSLTPVRVAEILTESADDLGAKGWDEEFGWGVLDAYEAVATAYEGGSTTTTLPGTTTTLPGTTTTTLPSTTTTTLPGTTTTTEWPGPRFEDVSDDTTPYWYEIEYLASRGVVTGFKDGLFRPEEAVIRQQFAKMIVLAVDCAVSAADTSPFTDVLRVSGDLYPYQYVAAAYRCGFTQGTTATHFSPYRTLTRAQLITMIARAATLTEPPVGYYPPFGSFSATHYPYARKAAYAGMLDGLVGMGSNYDFFAPASRGEVCALLYALMSR